MTGKTEKPTEEMQQLLISKSAKYIAKKEQVSRIHILESHNTQQITDSMLTVLLIEE